MHAHTLTYMVETSNFMRASSHALAEACALCRTRASDTEQRAVVQLTAAIASSISTICPHLAADAVPCHPRLRRDWPTSAPGLVHTHTSTVHICAGTCRPAIPSALADVLGGCGLAAAEAEAV